MLGQLIKKHKLTIAFIGDIAIFFLSMLIVLYSRYGNAGFFYQLSIHRDPLLLVLIIWITIFYISDLYTSKAFNNIIEISRRLTTSLVISFSITITIFYIFSRFFFLTPKANLVMLTVTFWILDILWRYTLRKIFLLNQYRSNVLLFTSSSLAKVLLDFTNEQPQLGYSLQIFNFETDNLNEIILNNSINLIIIDGDCLKNDKTARIIYGLIPKDVKIMLLTDFYELLLGSIPLPEIGEEWFIREITKDKSIYESIKRIFEFGLVFISLPISLPLSILIGLLIKITSPGPIIYRQERIGKNNKPFFIYKFRTMKFDQTGPLWTMENDDRITFFGKFLRHTHLDEIPQLLNVLKGDISFIGPRPERSKLVEIYESIPYYEIRHIIKPGIIGWAQLNYPPSASLDEAQKKFQYDLYYLKNRSFALDLYILIKTIRKFFVKI
jgi:exopolysaccharide biosynthesis polyprenyl glycosylphosphotransferase